MADPTQAWLAETFHRNRERFGGWRMMADPAPTPDPAPEPTPSDPPADPPKDPAADPKDDGKGGKDALLADLAKERDKRQGLEQQVSDLQKAQQKQLDDIAVALGLKQSDAPPDAAALATQIQAAQDDARDARRQLAVVQAAPALEGNAALLLDSASFLRSIADIDPADTERLGEAIKTAIDANPALKTTASTPAFPGGPRPPAPPARAGSLQEAIERKLADASQRPR